MTASPSASVWPTAIPHETLDQAAELGQISPGLGLEEAGSIGDGPYGAADVVWYRFTLESPALVHFGISRQDPSSSFNGVLSLFDSDPNDYFDPYNGDGYHLIEQVDAKSGGGVATFDRPLGQGTYYLAVSGDGNLYFQPLLADSGLPGSTGEFDLQVSATTDTALATAIGPQILTSDPASGASLSASPLAIRVEFSGAIDPSTIAAGQNVQLLESPDGQFAVDGQQVPLNSVNFSPVVVVPTPPGGDGLEYQGLDELQIFPGVALSPGDYEVVLDGQGGAAASAMTDNQGNPLGADADHPEGQDLTIPFQVVGIEGRTGSAAVEDDTPKTAQQLGDLTSAGLVQVAGAIGTDPGPDAGGNPANQVDLYHFQVTGPGDSSLVAQIFAGRIGSTLQAGLSLFRLDPTTQTLVFVAGDMNSYDTASTTDGFSQPLYSDSLLDASLTAGDYYIAVAGAFNTPSPLEGQYYDPTVDPGVTPPGLQVPPYSSYGLYDPNLPGSAQNGFSTGPYVLNLMVQPALAPPRVVSTSIAPDATLNAAPTQLTVTFDQPMNLAQLSFQSYQATVQDSIATVYDSVPGVSIVASDGTVYVPRFVSYDATTNQATFQMLGALPNGSYHLQLSGAGGVADLGGSPLVGNDPSGDYVVPFIVNAASRGVGGDPLQFVDQEPNDSIGQPQDIGTLFPDDLTAGVTITRDFSQNPAAAPRDTADVYAFQILLDRTYIFTLSGSGVLDGATMTLTDGSGNPVTIGSYGGTLMLGELAPGDYLLTVGGWDASIAPGVGYQVSIVMSSQNDNAPPLISGPAPAFTIQLAGAPSTVTPTPTTPTPTPPPPPPSPTTPTPIPPPLVTPPDPPSPTGLVVGPSPSDSLTGGESSPTETAPTVLSLSIPSSATVGSGSFGPISTVSALTSGPVGGVVAPEGSSSSGAMLAQIGPAGASPSVAASLITLGTSLHMIGTGEEELATPPASAEAGGSQPGASAEVPDWRALIAMVEASLTATDRRPAVEAVLLELPTGREVSGPSPGIAVEPGSVRAVVGAPSSVAAGNHEEETSAESRPSEGVRVVLMAFTVMAVGAYARCRGLVRRDAGHGRTRPMLGLLRRGPDGGLRREGI